MREAISAFLGNSCEPLKRPVRDSATKGKFLRAAMLSLHVVFPTLLGGAVYLLWRADSLRLFSWLDALGLNKLIQELRSAAYPIRTHLPVWTIFSVPAGLWMYSLVAGLRVIWRHDKSRRI